MGPLDPATFSLYIHQLVHHLRQAWQQQTPNLASLILEALRQTQEVALQHDLPSEQGLELERLVDRQAQWLCECTSCDEYFPVIVPAFFADICLHLGFLYQEQGC